MCRESRKIFDELNKQAVSYDVQGITTPAHVYICDRLICEFYTSPIINILKQRIKSIKRKEWKHFTIDYWEPVIRQNLKNAIGTHRDSIVSIGDNNQDGFTYIISNYLISDYSITDAIMLNKIVNNTSLELIKYACEEAKKYRVYEIRYINAIIEKEKAKYEMKIQSINDMSDKINKSNRLVDAKKQSHTVMDIASAEYNYNNAMQNAELERKFMEVFGND